MFFYKIYIILRKNVFKWKKRFTLKCFLIEKNINENVKITYFFLISKLLFYFKNFQIKSKINLHVTVIL